MAENKTKPTGANVDDFLLTVSERRASEARQLIALMQTISGEPPVMWGPSIIGFGTTHYTYDTGREGDMGRLGFSPRKASLTIYFSEGFDRYGEQLKKLGAHTHSVSCLYVTNLSNIDMDVLREMLQISYEVAGQSAPEPADVAAYVAAVPRAARPLFDELRTLVKAQLPHANEVASYGIIGYKIDDKRARVFISGWKDHLGVYPVPKDEALQAELAPYRKGKGTLWFMLDAPLPKALIRRVVAALAR